MNHSETEIPIISGYLRLECIIDDGWTVQLPSQTLLEEIVRFPKIDRRYPDPCDPFNVERYRIRDREAKQSVSPLVGNTNKYKIKL